MGGQRRVSGGRVISLVVAITLLVTTLVRGSPANAANASCEEIGDRITHWSEEEVKEGLTTSRLGALQELIPLLVDCSETEITGHGEMGSDVGRWRVLVDVYFNADDVDRVICLMEKESGGNPNALNRSSGAAGLMQVMPSWAGVFGYTPDDLFDPIVNLWIARQIRDQQGWDAWTPYLRGSCR